MSRSDSQTRDAGKAAPTGLHARGRRLVAGVSRAESLALPLLVAGIALLPGSVPAGVYGIGVIGGLALAMQGVALVLVYRSNKIINFAQASYAFAAALLFSALVQYGSLLRLIEPLCPNDCTANPVVVHLSYWVSLAISLAFVLALGWLTHRLVVRRLTTAPALLLTVATIFVGFVVVALTSQLTQQLVPDEVRETRAPPPGAVPAAPPFDVSIQFGGATFHLVDVLTAGVALIAVAGLFLFLQRSATGNAIRAASEDADRAATLGVNVDGLTARVWVIAAGLAGVGGILISMSQGAAAAFGNSSTEVRILAIAVAARLTSFPRVVVAGLLLGIWQQAVQWTVGSTLALDAALFVVIGVVLLAQTRHRRRADAAPADEWRSARETRPIPSALRSLPVVRKWRRAGIAAGVLFVLAFPWLMSPSNTNLGAAVLVYTMIGLSLLVLTGWAGQISLGQVAFAAVGAYVAAVSDIPFPLSLLAGGLAGAVIAFAVGLPALRLRGLHLAVITLAFHQAVIAVGLNPAYLGAHLPERFERPTVLGMGLDDQRAFYYLVLLATVAVVAAVVGMRRSRTARALLATRDNPEAAQAFGINLTRTRMGAFAVSGFIAAFAGVLLAYHQSGVHGAAFGVDLSRTVFLHTVIGGLGSVAGPVIGFAYYALPLFVQLPALLAVLLTGPGGLLLLLFAPGGLAQLFFEARDAWVRRVARRHRVMVPGLFAEDSLQPDGRVRLAPKTRPGGGAVFVPVRYQLSAQWAVEGVGRVREAGGVPARGGVEGGGS